MSRILLPKMVGRGGGVIVNISSSASLWPLPEMSVYSATKVRETLERIHHIFPEGACLYQHSKH